jgi:hypothetical protein
MAWYPQQPSLTGAKVHSPEHVLGHIPVPQADGTSDLKSGRVA